MKTMYEYLDILKIFFFPIPQQYQFLFYFSGIEKLKQSHYSSFSVPCTGSLVSIKEFLLKIIWLYVVLYRGAFSSEHRMDPVLTVNQNCVIKGSVLSKSHTVLDAEVGRGRMNEIWVAGGSMPGSWFWFVTDTQQTCSLPAAKFLYDANKITDTKHFLLWSKYSTGSQWEGCVHRVWRVFCYKLEAWHRTQVPAVENAWRLRSDPVMHLHGSLLALLSGPVPCLFTLHLYWFTSLVSLERMN